MCKTSFSQHYDDIWSTQISKPKWSRKNLKKILVVYYIIIIIIIHYCTKYNYVDPHQKIMFSIIIVECFKFFLSVVFFLLKKMYVSLRTKWLLPLFNANEAYNKNKSQNNESCYDLKSTFKKNSLIFFLLWNEVVCRIKRFVRLCGISWKSSDSSPQYSTTCRQTI